ncbi:hypothetical protein NVP1121O_145 [Vibrio phage 1.121.O._10N.286.46.C4]|nr:hypothetical protein NVP1121O_145 [Vibrio phage 1.121.O._10N.286.46.C4]
MFNYDCRHCHDEGYYTNCGREIACDCGASSPKSGMGYTCRYCDGEGEVVECGVEVSCSRCNGTGRKY